MLITMLFTVWRWCLNLPKGMFIAKHFFVPENFLDGRNKNPIRNIPTSWWWLLFKRITILNITSCWFHVIPTQVKSMLVKLKLDIPTLTIRNLWNHHLDCLLQIQGFCWSQQQTKDPNLKSSANHAWPATIWPGKHMKTSKQIPREIPGFTFSKLSPQKPYKKKKLLFSTQQK